MLWGERHTARQALINRLRASGTVTRFNMVNVHSIELLNVAADALADAECRQYTRPAMWAINAWGPRDGASSQDILSASDVTPLCPRPCRETAGSPTHGLPRKRGAEPRPSRPSAL